MLYKENIKVTPQMLVQIAELDEFKGAWTGFANLRPEQLKNLKKVSTIESIGSSNRIEGNKLSDAEVEELLSRIEKKSFESRDEEEIAGYAELMNIIFDNYLIIPLSENYIKQLHKILLQFVGKDKRHRGEYKKIHNDVVAYDPNGKEIGIVFETAAPFDTPRLMEELIEWTRKNLDDPFLHPLIVIGVFVVHFLAIHPFQDGNGRLSRVITTMLLLKKGYDYVIYSSIESVIEAAKEGYYLALRRTQKNIWSSKVNYEPWLSYFITTLQKQKRHLEDKIKTITIDETKLTRNQKAILKLFNEETELSASEVAGILSMNKETVKKNIRILVYNGYLTKYGTTKGTWYKKING
jgi:Fic family protein